MEYIAFIKVLITNVIYHWEEEQQFLCSFQAWSFTSYSIRIWIWTVCSWHWKPTSAQFNFLVMTLKQPSGYMVELSTFLTWWMKEVIGHKTLSLLNSKIIIFDVKFVLHTKMWINCESIERKCKTESQAFIQGTNVVTKHQVWIFFL